MDRVGEQTLEPGTMEAYDENGVDRSLIRWMLSLSPTKRLDYLRSSLELIASARPLRDEPR